LDDYQQAKLKKMMTLHTSTGVLEYARTENYGFRCVLGIDQEISNYYRALLPKWISTNRQMYPAHVSVVRKEVPPNLDVWGRHDGEVIEFQYEHFVYNDETYFWLNVFCSRLEEIRAELGLPVSSPITRPPSGFLKCFHTTIGNCKGHPKVQPLS
jgi:hypothetical protein